jgi:N-carbamoyl-D-amino-acid hydrolase
MSRIVTVAAAQMGPVPRSASRRETVGRLIGMLVEAHGAGADLVVFPEAALTAFFPHWFMADEAEIDSYFETAMPGPDTAPLFETASRLGIGFCLGYAELCVESGVRRRFNTSILVDRSGRIVGKYRKVHLPGYVEPRPEEPFQNLEKRYFAVGDLGFPAWRAFGGVFGMLICNDRRWPEAYRCLGLQGVEMILLGYNTPVVFPAAPEQDAFVHFHNHLSMQAGAYQNGAWVVGVAKAGVEENVAQIGGTAIIAPSGVVVAQATTLDDEIVIARCDLDLTRTYKETMFNFAQHRRPEAYGRIVAQTGATPPGATPPGAAEP